MRFTALATPHAHRRVSGTTKTRRHEDARRSFFYETRFQFAGRLTVPQAFSPAERKRSTLSRWPHRTLTVDAPEPRRHGDTKTHEDHFSTKRVSNLPAPHRRAGLQAFLKKLFVIFVLLRGLVVPARVHT